jgi:hypothetical protein
MTYINPQPDGTFDLMVDKPISGDWTISVVHSRYRTVEEAQAAKEKLAAGAKVESNNGQP